MFLKVLVLLLMSFFIAEAKDFEKLIKEADIIYIPEEHTSESDHHFQLMIIKHMYAEGYKLVIGMEMFQQSFQRYLDDYIDGKISEEEMIEKSQYRKRWGYEPSLYSPIWKFAKEKGIRLYALNIPSELLEEVKRYGVQKIENPIIPKPLIQQKEEEKEHLLEVLKSHPKVDEKSFLEVQNLWDNVMAYAIVRIIKENPNTKVVVLAGKGHIGRMDVGIPYRVKKLDSSLKQVILTPERCTSL
jgi:uncharacterized iron-regulated protein